MVAENDEMHIGWPLGLGFFNMRLRIVESFPDASLGPYSLHVPSTSFSSFSSSSLDTESTASFFQDKSVSLAHLIGIRQGDRGGGLHCTNTLLRCEERRRGENKLVLAKGSSDSDASKEHNMSRGICLPILLHTLKKITITKSKKTSRN